MGQGRCRKTGSRDSMHVQVEHTAWSSTVVTAVMRSGSGPAVGIGENVEKISRHFLSEANFPWKRIKKGGDLSKEDRAS